MVNQTIRKFGYPESLIETYEHWVLLARPAQVTLGSLVLAAKSEATSYAGLEAEAFSEQGKVVAAIERALTRFCAYERINYLMLMMVDPNVHFHVIPRYSGERKWQGLSFPDAGWPGPPNLKAVVDLSEAQIRDVAAEVRKLLI